MENVRIVKDALELSQQAAAIILKIAHASIQQRGMFRLCLAGGNTPRSVYQRLAEPQNLAAL
jgi:6-phosphogluconolactonase/glucosamine-6-phosphate isomerase/deaminase